MIKINKETARAFLTAKQGFNNEKFVGKQGILSFIEQAGSVQFDPIDVCGKNHELVFQSRVKDFTKELFDQVKYADKLLVDADDKCKCIIHISDWGNFSLMRQHMASLLPQHQEVEDNKQNVLNAIKENGAMCSTDFCDNGEKLRWWWSATNVNRATLEKLYFEGKIVIHHRKGSVKYYDLAENFLPADIYNSSCSISQLEFYEWQLLRRIGAVGMLANRASDAFIGMSGFKSEQRKSAFGSLLEKELIMSIDVDGTVFYIKTEDQQLLQSEGINQVRFIAPLDNFMWDRRLIEELYNFAYRWEIYTPQSKRQYGYYVLPVYYNSQFVGRIEPVADRKNSTLNINNFWYEQNATKCKKQIKEAIESFAEFNNCNSIKINCEL